jgi:hypothetical protein
MRLAPRQMGTSFSLSSFHFFPLSSLNFYSLCFYLLSCPNFFLCSKSKALWYSRNPPKEDWQGSMELTLHSHRAQL